MGLSSFDNCNIPEVTSPSTPCKAWNIQSTLSEKDEKRIRDRFQFLDSVRIRISSDEDRACHLYADEVYFYEANFLVVFVFPFIPLLGNFSCIGILPQHN